MNYFHVYWTRPNFPNEAEQATKDIELPDFEALTWLVSALELRRHSTISLLTDERGLQFARRTGLDWVYNGGISTCLEKVPANIDPKIFWNAGKLFAWTLLPGRSVMVDTDAILWQPLKLRANVLALHTESAAWPVYAPNRERYGRFGLTDADWDWHADVLNTALWSFRSAACARACATRVLQFMADFTRAVRDGTVPATGKGPVVVFAGQHLPAMCVRRAGLRAETVGVLRPDCPQLQRNPICTHLWMSKDLYRACPSARRAFNRYLVRRIHAQFPEAVPTLQRWGMQRDTFDGTPADPDLKVLPAALRQRIRAVKGVKDGEVWIRDANLDALRPARDGAWLLNGECLVQGRA